MEWTVGLLPVRHYLLCAQCHDHLSVALVELCSEVVASGGSGG